MEHQLSLFALQDAIDLAIADPERGGLVLDTLLDAMERVIWDGHGPRTAVLSNSAAQTAIDFLSSEYERLGD